MIEWKMIKKAGSGLLELRGGSPRFDLSFWKANMDFLAYGLFPTSLK